MKSEDHQRDVEGSTGSDQPADQRDCDDCQTISSHVAPETTTGSRTGSDHLAPLDQETPLAPITTAGHADTSEGMSSALSSESSVHRSVGVIGIGEDLAFSIDTIPEGMTAQQWKIELKKKRREIRKEQAM